MGLIGKWTLAPSRRGTLRHWLQASGSLSARLAATGVQFSVQVLAQGRQPLSLDEAKALGQGQKRVGYAREVLLSVDDTPWVFARSVTTHCASVGPWRAVRGLGSRPLANVLFKGSDIRRTPLAFKTLTRQSPAQRHLAGAWQKATGQTLAHPSVPARRSAFYRHGAALVVMEVFAADAQRWQRMRCQRARV